MHGACSFPLEGIMTLGADIEGSAAPQWRSGRSDRETSYSLGRLARGAGKMKSGKMSGRVRLVECVYEKEAQIVSSDNFTLWGTIVGHVGHVLHREDMDPIYPIPRAPGDRIFLLSPATARAQTPQTVRGFPIAPPAPPLRGRAALNVIIP